MSTLQSTPRLSLFEIESELLQLIDAREDALERLGVSMSNPEILWEKNYIPVIREELATIEGLIREYVKREIRKVDSTAYAIKEFEARAAARKTEAEKMLAAAERDAETVKRIKAMVLEVMQEFDEKKLPGRLFTIMRQGNGGVQALTIAQPDLVPNIFKTITVTMAWEDWQSFVELGGRFLSVDGPQPWTEKIREALERGEGVMGARLEDRAEHIRIK